MTDTITPEDVGALRRLAELLPYIEAVVAGQRLALEMLQGTASPKPEPRVYPEKPVWLGNGQVRLGSVYLRMDEQTGRICEVFSKLGPAMNAADIDRELQCEKASRYLKRIRDRYPELAPFIVLPGGKGRGGYRFEIIDGSDAP